MRTVSWFAMLAVLGCATVTGGGPVRDAALQAIGAEQIAWSQSAPPPKGMESMVALTIMTARIDDIQYVSDRDATALITYKYTGRIRTDSGERAGTMTVQRKLHFSKNGEAWAQTGATEEVARHAAYNDRSADS